MKYKTREKVADVFGIAWRIAVYAMIIFGLSVLASDITNTWHDTRIICQQVTHSIKECR